MKKYFIFILLISIIISISYAQKPDGFHAGIIGGLVASQVDGDNYAGYNRLGLQFGGFTKFKLNQDWGGQVEIKYLQKGSKQVSQKNGIFFEIKLDYVEVPVLVNYQFDEKMYAEGGFAFAYLIGAHEDRDGYGFSDYTNDFEAYDLSALIGFNYIFNAHFIGNVKYSYSMLPIRPHPGNQTYWGDMGCYNNLVSAALYYKF